MNFAQKTIQGINTLISIALGLVLILMLLFSGYALWDSYLVQSKANLSSEVMHYQPTVNLMQEDNPSLLKLRALNSDVKAWVTLDGTRINYPVLHGKDNVHYLNRDFYGQHSVAGSVFLDYRNSGMFTDSYAVLYGHNMSGGLMFADLLHYSKRSFFDQHQTGHLFLTDKTFELEIFAYLHEDAYETPIFNTVNDIEGYESRLAYIRQTAAYYRDIGLTSDQQIVLLSTCSSSTTNDRSIIVARMKELKTVGGVPETP